MSEIAEQSAQVYAEEPKHNWLITHSGKQFDITKMQFKDICLDDIAHHLTKECRYGRATDLDVHYSVAQHSIALANYALKIDQFELARYLLLHDASEAYLGDVVKGLKGLLKDYEAIEETVSDLIYCKYRVSNINYLTAKLGKELDTRILLDESPKFVPKHKELFKHVLAKYEALGVPLANEYGQLQVVKDCFLAMCEKLNIKD